MYEMIYQNIPVCLTLGYTKCLEVFAFGLKLRSYRTVSEVGYLIAKVVLYGFTSFPREFHIHHSEEGLSSCYRVGEAGATEAGNIPKITQWDDAGPSLQVGHLTQAQCSLHFKHSHFSRDWFLLL